MNRLKTFGKYLLLIIAFYIVSNILAYFCIETTYSNIEKEIEQADNINLTIDKAEATIINGKISGTVTNTSTQNINLKYIQIDLISKKDNLILTKYLRMDELKANETKDFKLSFQAENIAKVRISITDTYVENGENTTLINIADANNDAINGIAVFISVLILAHYFL